MQLREVIKTIIVRAVAIFYVENIKGGFWRYRNNLINNKLNGGVKVAIYNYYMSRHGFSIGLGTKFKSKPILPHEFNGIHVSTNAVIGENVIIFQQVTIGSNNIAGHPRCGSPTIGNNVLIGAGAKIIGKVTIGDNCRIGANAVVATDMPANTTAVAATTRFISHNTPLVNEFRPVEQQKFD